MRNSDTKNNFYTFCWQIITDRVSGEGNAIGPVRPSVCFHPIISANLPLTLIFCLSIWVTTTARRGFKVKRGQSKGRPCAEIVSVETENNAESRLWLLPKPKFTPKMKSDFWPKAETDDALCHDSLVRHGSVYMWPICNHQRTEKG